MPTYEDLNNDQIKRDKKFLEMQNEVLLLALQVAAYEFSVVDKRDRKMKRKAPREVYMARWLYDAEEKLGTEKEIARVDANRRQS